MNINNDLATTLFACNNNVVLGDRVCFYYVTLYQTKKNQKEESASFHNVCLALCKRIQYQQDHISEKEFTGETTEEIAPDFCEGLKRMLSAVYAHTAHNVLSSTMAWKLLYQGSRFKFSHGTEPIPLHHMIEWSEGRNNLSFKLKKINLQDKTVDHVVDMFINNIIYRPFELNNLSCYELISEYEMQPSSKKNIEDGDYNIESATTFNFCKEHPCYKYNVMRKRNKFVVPSISSTKEFPNITELNLDNVHTDDLVVIERRERYGQLVLLLFYPFRDRFDLKLDNSYWKRYKKALENKLITSKCLQVIQNIQDVTYNCKDLKVAGDIIDKTTEYVPHEDDNKKFNDEKENTASLKEFEAVMNDIY